MPPRQPDPYLRKFREIRDAHPELELDECWRRAGVQLVSTSPPGWADGRASPKPAFYRGPRPRDGSTETHPDLPAGWVLTASASESGKRWAYRLNSPSRKKPITSQYLYHSRPAAIRAGIARAQKSAKRR